MTLHKARLLIVDDDVSVRTSLSQIFLGFGYHVRSASDGFSALSEMRTEVPDVLISDLNMPGMSGFELLSVVRRRFPSIHVIAMSGAISGDEGEPAIPADAFHGKATSFPRLLLLVQAAERLERASLFDRNVNGAPVWLARNTHTSSDAALITITCPDCLRTFAEFPGANGANVYEASCTHCATPVRYAIVPHIDVPLSMTLQPS